MPRMIDPEGEGVRVALTELINELDRGDLDSAEGTLESLGFDRLRWPIHGKGPPQTGNTAESAESFGRQRIDEVGACLDTVNVAIARRDKEAALRHARRALDRWNAGK